MRDLKFNEIKEVNGGDAECAVAVTGFVLALASVVVSPATGFTSLVVSQAAIAASTVSMGMSCSGGDAGAGNSGGGNSGGGN